jgi:hypothetical protein
VFKNGFFIDKKERLKEAPFLSYKKPFVNARWKRKAGNRYKNLDLLFYAKSILKLGGLNPLF